ncbi:MAG: cytochrome c3 family protein [Planctomycetota bacterium]
MFIALAAWFALGPRVVDLPIPPAASVTPDEARPRAMRPPPRERPLITVAGFEMNCMECHRLFDSAPDAPRRLAQHRDINLDHGLNDRCFNCHDRHDRNRLALRGNRTVPFTNVARMCAECHGPTYRDWQRGMHGQTMGYWDAEAGAQRRLHCSECHDPHSPAFRPMAALPGPNTLRMGDQTPAHGEAVEAVDPLRKWQHLPGHGAAAPDDAPDHAPDHEPEEVPHDG